MQWQGIVVSAVRSLGPQERSGWAWMENRWDGEDMRKNLRQQSRGHEWVMELGAEKTRSTRKVTRRDNSEITYQCSFMDHSTNLHDKKRQGGEEERKDKVNDRGSNVALPKNENNRNSNIRNGRLPAR